MCIFFFFFGASVSSIVSLFFERAEGFLETLVILSPILLPVKSLVASVVFCIALFESVFIASVVDFLALSRSFWPYFLFNCPPMFLAKDKNPYPFTYVLSLGSIEYLIFIQWNCIQLMLHLITKDKFILYSISNG